jgi:uncharacterized protein (TIGR02246 family)
MKATLTFLSFAIVMASSGFGVEAATKASEATPEMAAALANARTYEDAYAKADVETLAAFFTEDAEYTSDTGRTFSGNAAIKACLHDVFRVNKGAKLNINVESAKPITSEVMVEKGSTTVVSPAGEAADSLYTAVHVKTNGQWKISQLVETPLPEIAPAERLGELSWLIGKWEEADKEAGVTIHSNYQWARGGNFITRNVTVKRDNEPVLEGWQIIGWDPVEESIRSWTFDDAGGFSDGLWTREGQRWLSRVTGYAADGSRTSSEQTITKAGDDRFYWESGNRTLDGDPQPGVGRIEIHRVKGD